MEPIITKQQFELVKKYITDDILRELDLARSGKSAGNYLCALGLLCYTEFAGGIKENSFEVGSEQRFNSFFQDMGQGYKVLLTKYNVYRDFRCCMAHQYSPNGYFLVSMLGNNITTGIQIHSDGAREFIVEKYFEDFMLAFEELYKKLLSMWKTV